MQDMIVGTVGAKCKAEVEEFDAKGHTHTSESNYAGINIKSGRNALLCDQKDPLNR